MRVLVREQIILGNGVNFETLTTGQRVRVAFLSLLQRFSIFNAVYESKQQQRIMEKAREQAEKDDFLKQRILIEFAKYFEGQSEEESVASIVIAVDAVYRDSLFRLLGLENDGTPSKTRNAVKAFSGYNITLVRENPDVRVAFGSDMPILIDCSRRYLVEVGA